MSEDKHIQMFFFLGLFLGAFVLAFFIFRPYLYSIILAAVFAVVFGPIHKKISQFIGGKKGIGALITLLIVFLIIFIPLFFFGAKVFEESRNMYQYVSDPGKNIFEDEGVVSYIQGKIQNIVPSFSSNANEYARQGIDWVFNNFGSIFSGITQFVIGLIIMFLSLFFFLKDGDKFEKAIFAYSPLEDKFDRQILHTLATVSGSVVRGTLVISILQGILAGLGFWIFGIPNPALWGLVLIVIALIPAVGAMVVIIPASAYLFFFSNPLFALGLLLWGIFVVSMADNILRPLLIEKSVDIHPFIIFLGVIGGMQFFGPMGFILGPIIISLLFTLFRMYPELLKK
jgi:predicted PurR-regulated permease PerM